MRMFLADALFAAICPASGAEAPRRETPDRRCEKQRATEGAEEKSNYGQFALSAATFLVLDTFTLFYERNKEATLASCSLSLSIKLGAISVPFVSFPNTESEDAYLSTLLCRNDNR